MYDYVFNFILLDNLIFDIRWEIIFSISILLIDEWLVSKRQIIGKVCEQLTSKNDLWLNWLSLWYEKCKFSNSWNKKEVVCHFI
jgi:hypothetical protein